MVSCFIPTSARKYIVRVLACALAQLIPLAWAIEGADHKVLQPTVAGVRYGSHERQFVDFYQACSVEPTPVVLYIHGGGWMDGSAGGILRTEVFGPDNKRGEGVRLLLEQGISVVAVGYRLVTQAHEAGVQPPVEWPMRDAARAVQFVRSRARDWNLDKTRLALTGSSAGGCSALWLAMHPDMADPSSADPVARESTRPLCVGVLDAQTSLDPLQLQTWFQTPRYGGHAFGFFKMEKGRLVSDMDAALASRAEILPWINEYSPIAWAGSSQAPVICLAYRQAPEPADQPQKDSVHGAAHGLRLQAALGEVGAECHVLHPGQCAPLFSSHMQFIINNLR